MSIMPRFDLRNIFKKKSNSIHKIPREILGQILGKLPAKDYFSAIQVNQDFYDNFTQAAHDSQRYIRAFEIAERDCTPDEAAFKRSSLFENLSSLPPSQRTRTYDAFTEQVGAIENPEHRAEVM